MGAALLAINIVSAVMMAYLVLAHDGAAIVLVLCLAAVAILGRNFAEPLQQDVGAADE